MRADLIMQFLEPEIRPLEYNTTMAVCDSTVGLVITKLLSDYPSLKEYVTCYSKVCQNNSEKQFIYLTFQIDSENNLVIYSNLLMTPRPTAIIGTRYELLSALFWKEDCYISYIEYAFVYRSFNLGR